MVKSRDILTKRRNTRRDSERKRCEKRYKERQIIEQERNKAVYALLFKGLVEYKQFKKVNLDFVYYSLFAVKNDKKAFRERLISIVEEIKKL